MLRFRHLAHVVIEAETPLAVGSGNKEYLTDSPILREANGLPIIHGTSLCGLIRSHFKQIDPENENDIFGYQDNDNADNSCGARLRISHAHIVDEQGKAVEGLITQKSAYLKQFDYMPMRQHCKINHRGAADVKAHGKFDTQVVFKGTRFKFSLEFLSDTQEEQQIWQNILNILSDPTFRLGGGTRKGFGHCKIVSNLSQARTFDLRKEMDDYLKIHSLNDNLQGNALQTSGELDKNWQKYVLKLTPENTWMFSCGFPDGEVDNTPVTEFTIKWNESGAYDKTSRDYYLVPATSLKGAIAHRVAFHYNISQENFADKIECMENHVGEKNAAVKMLFGCAKNSKDNIPGQRGNVILSDLFLEHLDPENNSKIFPHVALDRFTQAPIDGALFQEKVAVDLDGKQWRLEILVNTKAFSEPQIKESLEKALNDICSGLLPLGGSTMKGHGLFSGELQNV